MKTLSLFITSLVLTAPLLAQTVKQGDPNVIASNEFHSPMVVETTFAPADPALWKSDDWTPDKPRPWKKGEFTTAEYYDLGKYSCDGLSIRDGSNNGTWHSGLVMSLKEQAGKLHITINAHVTNPGYVHDKSVTATLRGP